MLAGAFHQTRDGRLPLPAVGTPPAPGETAPVTQLCLLPPLACLPLRFNRCSFPGNTGGEAGVRVRPHLQGQPRLLGWQPAAFPDGSTSRSSKLWHRPQQLRVRGVRCRGGQARPGSEEELGSRWTTGRWTPDPPGSAEEGWGGELLQEGLSAQPSCPQSSQPGDSCLRAFFLIEKQRHYFASKGSSSQGYGFFSSHVWM